MERLAELHTKLVEITDTIVSLAWGPPLVVLLVGGGLFLTIYSRGIPFLRIRHAVDVLRGKFDDPDDPGEITHLQALATALASTVGVGNIGGVAIAISQGGAGAVFWMWVAAFVGMATKFFTCTLACMYRKVDESSIPQGGPMYFIEVGLGPKFKPLAIMFSVCGLVGCLAMLQANQLTVVLEPIWSAIGVGGPEQPLDGKQVPGQQIPIASYFSAVLIAAVVAVVVFGGLRRLVKFSEKLVPTMCGIYVLGALAVLAMRFDRLPGVLLSIVQEALSPEAIWGGAAGSVIIIGVKRAAFSNEAGVGTAAMAHGAAKTDEPVREGLVAMLGPLIDTLIVCSMTALVILASDLDVGQRNNLEGVALTSAAFESVLGATGAWLVTIAVILFSVTTMFGYSYYGRKCMTYLVGHHRGHLYNYIYIASLAVGAIVSVTIVVNVIDAAYAMMAIPTMTGALLLSPRVMKAARDYFARFDAGQ
ncbi:alanine:cation symporter family protein [Aeoliella sp. ICT_H6.2]|uniref:Alanine:cation symporter family protein n=1 Tax=Aeoliella straminimaris TaxID=2954799 RepID=A0A9X2FEG8_9BACT|nr:alanine/glycine:cation symporter family protein [Aeoliella straminimaris]MCO6046537.1 alanine:cation symporter family protein [Aeoliella straminimaris]